MAGPQPSPRLFPEKIPGGTAPRLLANTHVLQVQAGSQACSGGRQIDSPPEAPREALRPTHRTRGGGNKALAQGGPSQRVWAPLARAPSTVRMHKMSRSSRPTPAPWCLGMSRESCLLGEQVTARPHTREQAHTSPASCHGAEARGDTDWPGG